jgi:hypothetical protein
MAICRKDCNLFQRGRSDFMLTWCVSFDVARLRRSHPDESGSDCDFVFGQFFPKNPSLTYFEVAQVTTAGDHGAKTKGIVIP